MRDNKIVGETKMIEHDELAGSYIPILITVIRSLAKKTKENCRGEEW